MIAKAGRQPARDPQDLERLLVARERAGDVEGMVALYEPDAMLDSGDGSLMRGHAEIRAFFTAPVASSRKLEMGKQSPATTCGDLALTSTHSVGGGVTAEVARRQADGTWLWAIDRFSVL